MYTILEPIGTGPCYRFISLPLFPQIECRVGLGTGAIKRDKPIDRSIGPFSIVFFFAESIISLLSLPRSNSDPGSPSRLFSLLPTTVRASIFSARRSKKPFPRRLASNRRMDALKSGSPLYTKPNISSYKSHAPSLSRLNHRRLWPFPRRLALNRRMDALKSSSPLYTKPNISSYKSHAPSLSRLNHHRSLLPPSHTEHL